MIINIVGYERFNDVKYEFEICEVVAQRREAGELPQE